MGHCAALVDLHGLECLTRIGEDLTIDNDGALTSLQGLASLTTLGGTLRLKQCAVLVQLRDLVRLMGSKATFAWRVRGA